MNYKTSIGYHDASFKIELIVNKSAKSNEEASNTGNDPNLFRAIFHEDKTLSTSTKNVCSIQN